MVKIITAVFDGDVFWPDEPLDLIPNARYRMIVKPLPGEDVTDLAPSSGVGPQSEAGETDPREERTGNAWDVLKRYAGTVDAPPNWSLRHDDDASDDSPSHSDPPTDG